MAYEVSIAPTMLAVPYITGRYDAEKLDFGNASPTFNYPSTAGTQQVSGAYTNKKQARSFGYAVGLTLAGCDWFEITREVRFVNETAAGLNTLFVF